MGGPAFYRHCREGGLSVTPEETDFMRNAWIETFREMKLHMQPEEIMSRASVRRFYGIPADDGEDEPEEDGYSGRRYIARCVNGFVRNNASKAAACNCQFQALVAYGAKLAGWNLLYRGGMQDRLGVFVHDEYLYYLRPDELDSRVPEIEGLMLEGMHVALPDVKVGVETSVSTHWDKHAPAFADLEKDGSGRYIIEPPDTVRGIYEKSETENSKKENQKQ